MKEIIKRAIEGGWDEKKWFETDSNSSISFFMDRSFWDALNKACGWYEGRYKQGVGKIEPNRKVVEIHRKDWLSFATNFYQINLTQGWDKAVEYLTNLIKS